MIIPKNHGNHGMKAAKFVGIWARIVRRSNLAQLMLCVCLSLLYLLFSRSGYAQAVIQQVIANDSIVPYQTGKPIHLAALDNDITFTFRPVKGDSILYQYQLSGFDKHWQSSPYPVARYTLLKGNEYRLLIRYRANGRLSAVTQVPVVVERELIEEWWFIPSVIVYVLVLLGAAMYFFLLYNFRQKIKVQSIRYRIAADLHDEVGATLSSIAMATNMVQRKMGSTQPDVQSLLANIKADSEETIHTIRDTVWTINPDNDSPDKLFEKMRSFAFQILTAQEIPLQFNNQVKFDKGLKVSMEQRRNLYLIFKEAINNIAKHSEATKAYVQITRSAEGLHWLIEDNGVGFYTDQQTEGNGLKNFRKRAAESFIDLILDSAPGKGTRITMTVPEL